MTDTVLRSYISQYHPQLLVEVSDKLKSIKCTPELVAMIKDNASNLGFDIWETKLITLATTLILCSPESIYTKSFVRKGVCRTVAKIFNVSVAAISKYISQTRYYYLNIDWVKVEVDKIVQEIKSTMEDKTEKEVNV